MNALLTYFLRTEQILFSRAVLYCAHNLKNPGFAIVNCKDPFSLTGIHKALFTKVRCYSHAFTVRGFGATKDDGSGRLLSFVGGALLHEQTPSQMHRAGRRP